MKKAFAWLMAALLAVMIFPATASADEQVMGGIRFDPETELINGYCNQLPSAVVIPWIFRYSHSKCTYIKGIDDFAFAGAPMESVVLPVIDLEIGIGVFQGCYNLKSFTAEGRLDISLGMFEDCRKLQKVVLKDGADMIGPDAFAGCTSLEEFDTGRVCVFLTHAFDGCTALKSIGMPADLQSIGFKAFYGCASLKEVTLPESTKKIESQAFGGCSSLEKVTILSRKVSIAADAFSGTPAVFYGLSGSDWQKTVEAAGKTFRLICEVQLDPQNGQPVTKSYPEAGAAMAKPADPVKTGHTFSGWYTDRNCTSGHAWDFSAPFAADTVLYAKWTPINYPVNFVGDSGQNSPSNTDYGTKLAKPQDPVRDGYVFTGWYKEAGFKHKWDFSRDVVKGETTLYAKFTPFTSYKLAFSAASADYRSIRLTWPAVQGAAGYEIWRSGSAKGKYKKVAAATGAELTDNKLETGKSYFYKIRAFRTNAGKTVFSAFSSPDKVMPVPAAAKGFTAKKISAKSVKFTWDAVEGGTVYEVWRKTGNNGRYSLIRKTKLTGFINTCLKKGRTYTYRLRACSTANGRQVNGAYTYVSVKM